MGDSTVTLMPRRGRVRSVLLVICALMLFLAGLFLLFAPALAQPDSRSGRNDGLPRIVVSQTSEQNPLAKAGHPGLLLFGSSPVGPDRWIMGAQSREPVSLPGG